MLSYTHKGTAYCTVLQLTCQLRTHVHALSSMLYITRPGHCMVRESTAVLTSKQLRLTPGEGARDATEASAQCYGMVVTLPQARH